MVHEYIVCMRVCVCVCVCVHACVCCSAPCWSRSRGRSGRSHWWCSPMWTVAHAPAGPSSPEEQAPLVESYLSSNSSTIFTTVRTFLCKSRGGLRQRTVRSQFYFAIVTHRGSVFPTPGPAKGRVWPAHMERHNWLAAPREGDSIDRCILSASGAWNHGRQASASGLKKAYVSQDRWILTGAARDGVNAVNLKC